MTFAIVLVPFLVSLGFWQLSREQGKISIQTKYAMRVVMPAISFEEIIWDGEDLDYLVVKANGRFDNEKTFLLDNKINQGSVGFEVISPYITESTRLIFVNRGWIAQGETRLELPSIENVEGGIEIQGSIYIPTGKQFMLAEQMWSDPSSSTQWPKIIQSIDIEQMSKELLSNEFDYPVFPYTLRLSNQSPGSLTPNWQLVSMQAEKHRAYAVQWFMMALALTIMTIYSTIDRERKTPTYQ